MYIYDRPLTAPRGLGAENDVLHGLGKRPEVVSPATPAEVKRRTEEIIQHAGERKWSSVEKNYNWLMENNAFDLIPKGLRSAADIHTMGAAAADALGEMKLKQDRLWRARKSMENAGVSPNAQEFRDNTNSLDAIDMAYGSVYIAPKTEPKSEKERKRLQGRGPALIPVVWPFAPDQRKSIEVAALVIKDTGSFTGLLPAGNYTLAGQPFTVTAGTELIRKKLQEFRWVN